MLKVRGGVWPGGGALGLSPADDILIRIERVLDIDPMGLMIASVLSKKVAVGATHVLIDLPIGPTAKVRSDLEFSHYENCFSLVGKAFGIHVKTLKTSGIQPLGKGIGPALEARDILAVLENKEEAPQDLKQKALDLAGILLEFGGKAPLGQGVDLAKQTLVSGKAFNKFLAICKAQGGFKEPPMALLTQEVLAPCNGIITEIDNRNLAKVAKLAGAPHDPAAGIAFFAKLGTVVVKGQPLYQIHAQSKGALHYSYTFALSMPNMINIKPES